MNEQAKPIRVAIACQGGGSHTAFTAGVLSRLLKSDVMADHEIVALSGTSGGAICALLARSEASRQLGATSKMNRDTAFLTGLIADGAATAGEFVTALAFEAAWRGGDPDEVWAFFADDCEITAEDPFLAMSPSTKPDTSRGFVIERLAGEIEIDLTRRQFAGDHFVWRVRFTGQPEGDRRCGQAGVRFHNGKITHFTLGPISGDDAIDRRIVL